jgi:hypothetical protein
VTVGVKVGVLVSVEVGLGVTVSTTGWIVAVIVAGGVFGLHPTNNSVSINPGIMYFIKLPSI